MTLSLNSGRKGAILSKEKTIPLKFEIPDEVITRYATNMSVQKIEREYVVSFFEQRPEVNFGPFKKAMTEVRAVCVASVVLTPQRFSKFVDTWRAFLDREGIT